MTAGNQVRWTRQQSQAILARGSNVLVTASAGTGKTAVLSGRCVSILSDGASCADVLGMLVLTFTEAAAEQMHARIAQQLREAYRRTREARLLRQLILLQGANISTIHSFCRRLITEHFHELSLDPAFRVIDGDEAMLLKAETLDETIEWAWRQESLAQGLRVLLDRRDLRARDGFLRSVIGLSGFLEGVVSPDIWCDHARRLAGQTEPLTSELGRQQQKMIGDRLRVILAQLGLAKRLYLEETPKGNWAVTLQEGLIDPAADCLERLDAGDWSGCAARIRDFCKPSMATPKELPETLAKVAMDLRKAAVEAFVGLRGLAVLNPEYLNVVGRSTGLQTRVLIELVQRFVQLYAQRKRSLNGLDFADLERYALRLLTREDRGDRPPEPSKTALVLRARFKHIFVDEYQDINPVQQAILDTLRSGNNVFVVGDVKQSIYAWRGAEPTIFLERLRLASTGSPDPTHGLRVDLNHNFRSVQGILDFANKVFGRIMTKEIAHIDYDETARLRPAPDEKVSRGGSPIVEMHILDEKGLHRGSRRNDADEAEFKELAVVQGRQRQAALIARRIREIVRSEAGRAEFQVRDKNTGSLRGVEYRDIVILMRSLAKKANDYVEILRLAGIPVSCDATAGYFEATEVRDMLSLLKVLDNPQRDIELATVLRSPFFDVTDTELVKVRMHGRSRKRAGFHACATWYCQDGQDQKLRKKLIAALERLEQWRRLACRGRLADLLWRVYRESGFLAFVSALPNGQARKANLLRLHDRAVQFEGFASNAGVASLTRFVDFLERLQEAGQDWAPAQPGSAAGNAVRILSVHKSKGLEFPVVFLAELETEFNKQDIRADVVADASDAVGLQVIDGRCNTKLRSLAHEVIGEKKLATALAEEMRVLYVAMTRARDRLILTALQTRTDCGGVLAKGVLLGGGAIPAWLLTPCKNALEWVLYGLSDQVVLHEAFGTGLGDRANDEGLFEFHLYDGQALRDLSRFVVALRRSKSAPQFEMKGESADGGAGLRLLAQVRKKLDRPYPFSHAIHIAAKSSVTRLTHPDDQLVSPDYSEVLDRRPISLAVGAGQSAPVPAREVGTAAHLVISSLDLGKPVTLGVIEKTRDGLIQEGAIPAGVAEAIDTEGIRSFFESDLGSISCDQRNTVWQEWPFTYGLPVRESDDAVARASRSADEVIVVQGVIDLLVRTADGLLVIDFKTDHVQGDDVRQRVDVYRGQLELYAKAAAAIRRETVVEKWLYFLTPRQAVRVSLR